MSGTPESARATSSAPAGPVLAFDYGTQKIGVALGNTVTGTARALTTLRGSSEAVRMEAIAGLVAEWGPALLVVGRPLHADGTAHAMTKRAGDFGRALQRRFGLPVIEADERYTTQLAGIEGRTTGRDRDAEAARIILQAWLDEPPAAPGRSP
jgi:putative Holliday junction resolvase